MRVNGAIGQGVLKPRSILADISLMAASIRLATRSDAALWLDLLKAGVGAGYPAPEVYDPAWIAGELAPQLDRQTWLAEAGGTLLASVSFLKPADANVNPVANLGRCLFRPEGLASGAAEELLGKVKELSGQRAQMAVARVASAEPRHQRLFEQFGFGCVGFQPNKHLMPGWQGSLFYVHFAQPLLVRRLPLSETLLSVCELGNFVLQSLALPPLVTVADGATGYPLQAESSIEEVSFENYQIWRRQAAPRLWSAEVSAGCNLGYGWLRVTPTGPPLALLAQREGGVSAGLAFIHDSHDRCLRVVESFHTDDLSPGVMLGHLVKLAQQRFHASYVEIDILMTATRLMKSAEQLGFVPVAYLPAFASQPGALVDVVKMVKLNVACSLPDSELARGAGEMVALTRRFFEDQGMSVAIVNLLRGLTLFEGLGDGEMRKVARLFQQKLFRAGETIFKKGDPGTEAFVVMRGAVEILLDDPPRPIATLENGQVLGEQAFLDGAPRTATAVASQPSIVLVVQRSTLHELTQREPHLGMVIMRNIALDLSNKLRRTNAKLGPATK